ncbi:MAG: hypothetical protein Q7Q71_05875 [Verrucomicrobiota bacterium JB023]|nr:hypothetical protein [Verrucomicrobiota bacterium JB023]
MTQSYQHAIALAGTACLGALLCSFGHHSISDTGLLEKKPNVACLKGSPYGRTLGLALQGPIVKFWDRGVGAVEESALASADEKRSFGDWLAALNEKRSKAADHRPVSPVQERHAMAKIEKRLALAWQMDPRNYSNYAIYQMFLFESFNEFGVTGARACRELSQATIQSCLSDQENPYSMLTGAQAAYDLVVTGAIFQEAFEGGASELLSYGHYVPRFLSEYEQVVSDMKANGSWANISSYRQEEMEARAAYLYKLNDDAQNLLRRVTQTSTLEKGGHSS